MLLETRNERGSYSLHQVRLARAVTRVYKNPVPLLEGLDVTEDQWRVFCSSPTSKAKSLAHQKKERREKRKKDKRAKILNAISKEEGEWDWRPKKTDIPAPKFPEPKGKKAKNSGRKSRKWNSDRSFYNSDDWKKLRVRVLEKYGCRCMMCGRTPREHRIIVHVDHIKPRSKHPELELEFNNMQVLCEDCNIGKGNRYSTDYRPDTEEISNDKIEELEIVLAAKEHI